MVICITFDYFSSNIISFRICIRASSRFACAICVYVMILPMLYETFMIYYAI